MVLFTTEQEALLRAQCTESREALAGYGGRLDREMPPVVEVSFVNTVYLLSELDDDDCLFGLCDCEGQGPKLGNVLLDTLVEKAQNDPSFSCSSIPQRPMSLADYLEVSLSRSRLTA